MAAYLGEANYMLYLRDRAFLNYHFSKLGKEGWAALANPDPDAAPDPNYAAAHAEFLAAYGLPELQKPRMTTRAHDDLRVALKQRRVAGWVLNLLRPDEIEELTREVKT